MSWCVQYAKLSSFNLKIGYIAVTKPEFLHIQKNTLCIMQCVTVCMVCNICNYEKAWDILWPEHSILITCCLCQFIWLCVQEQRLSDQCSGVFWGLRSDSSICFVNVEKLTITNNVWIEYHWSWNTVFFSLHSFISKKNLWISSNGD